MTMHIPRTRALVLVLVCVLVIGGAGTYIVISRARQTAERAGISPAAQTSLEDIIRSPHIVFRSENKRSGYGQVAVVSLADASGPRAMTPVSCDRVYATDQRYLCVSTSAGVVTADSAHVLDSAFTSEQSLPLTGVPSRARLSRDGTLAATTSFISGDSYAATSFSTQTVVTRIGGASYGSLESFTLIQAGERVVPLDRNYWGVTFAADDDTFYATVRWSQHTWLVKGSLSQRVVTTLHEDAECPSLSPDGQHLVYKQRGDLPSGRWRLVRYDLASGAVAPLAETRSVDDQVEWLDNGHVTYGIPRTGADAGTDDVWQVPVDGSGPATLLIPQAWSPSVVR
ncbi:MAG: hypothetical protein HY829_09030 [Actinobacteria bacterium]|nr:hypothetical protein [Actinomycetota bacterium]